MNNKVITGCISLLLSIPLFAQPELADTVFNQSNEKGQKTGYWKKTYPNGNPVYIGYFKQGKPVGKMTRYYDDGVKKAELTFLPDSNITKAILFYPNEEKAAEGNYINQKRHGEWRFFSYYDQTLKAIEHYNHGLKVGQSRSYYSSGQIAQELKWKEGKENGAWKQYFENGLLKLQALFRNGKLHGDYLVYHPNGQKYVQGQYQNGLMHGNWTYFNENGTTELEVTYENGKLVKGQELIEQNQEFFDMIEENKGQFTEPTVEDVLPM
ncbi:MAG: hypothetical protein GVY19_00480 [Bacteroidetes bacterium]|jgi:antitoxin component YwqK of YwqJK toxin-antitoxin module|nr:hypothetical protein [Bacteroidota bacterium]